MWKKIGIGLAVFIAAALFGVAWYFTSLFMHPKIKECPKDHFVYCGDPSELGLAFQEIAFKSQDGMTLKGWYIPAGNSKKAVVLVHGHTATRHEGLRWAKALHGAGFNIIAFDLRNSGESDKSFYSMGYYEKYDVIAAVDYAQKSKGMRKIGVFGVSLGGASGILAMAMDKRIEAGIFEASYADFSDLIAQIAKRDFGLPRFPLVPLTMWVFELRGRLDVDGIRPEKVIGSISPRPVFIMHCKTDPYTPYSHAERIFAKAGQPKEMWTHDCKIHAEAWQANPAYSEKRVTGFFAKYL